MEVSGKVAVAAVPCFKEYKSVDPFQPSMVVVRYQVSIAELCVLHCDTGVSLRVYNVSGRIECV